MKLTVCLFVLLGCLTSIQAQNIPYGDNPKAGKYVQSGDARIYYEVYGEGPPLLLLHGGYYGYISEYEQYYPDLTKNFKVIAVATRGHGRSEIGHTPMTYKLFAQDALAVLKNEKIDKALVMGFSDGAITGNILAAEYPEHVVKLVSMAGALNTTNYRPNALEYVWAMTGKNEEQNLPQFLKDRKKIMPEPQRFAEWVDMLKNAWLEPVWLSEEKAATIKCPVLIVAGDRDDYTRTEAFVAMYKLLPNAQLLMLPNSGHVSLILNPAMLRDFIIPFLKAP
ncbi:alpha/beta fold hydrolase [Chryseolinea soli]|uniref:Alpha/beta hydrolase n=1 Tax=Chryseolinea soli TaxID=2321403 RepID=A0A385SJH1_9BACT|nr:alpha/beta hydrolase [Chryseolinea soli]AYB30075.1 alpha/beta hydrolase [Chryseolinea soli]